MIKFKIIAKSDDVESDDQAVALETPYSPIDGSTNESVGELSEEVQHDKYQCESIKKKRDTLSHYKLVYKEFTLINSSCTLC